MRPAAIGPGHRPPSGLRADIRSRPWLERVGRRNHVRIGPGVRQVLHRHHPSAAEGVRLRGSSSRTSDHWRKRGQCRQRRRRFQREHGVFRFRIDPHVGLRFLDVLLRSAVWAAVGSSPPGNKILTLITDPNYRYPLMTGSVGTAPTYDDARTANTTRCPPSSVLTRTRRARPRSPRSMSRHTRSWRPRPPTRSTAITPASTSPDLAPGMRRSRPDRGGALLKPGAYYLKSGADISGRLIGGYEAGSKGVALMFDEAGSLADPAPNASSPGTTH